MLRVFGNGPSASAFEVRLDADGLGLDELDAPLADARFACRRLRASTSRRSSLVSKAGHVCLLKVRKLEPMRTVKSSNILSVSSVCMRSLAIPCQCAQKKSKRKTARLCGSGRSPSKTGIAH